MSRPKGSKNKPKEIVKVKNVAVDDIVEATPKSLKEIFQPKPDMGAIKPPPAAEFKCNCSHEKKLHYGGAKDWCNVTGCKCQEFKS